MSSMSRILMTGSTGFVGGAITSLLTSKGHFELINITRKPAPVNGASNHVVRDIATYDGWPELLSGVDVVIHSAARVHVMSETDPDPLAAFRAVNVEATLRLAKEAELAGAKRFIYISSIKVNGESTRPGVPFRADDVPSPQDPYGVSKMEAEQALLKMSESSAMDVVIIRPVLVYGPGVKANFASMMNWLMTGVPLPLGLIKNKRSLVSSFNLAHLVLHCVDHPKASNKIFLVSDGEDLSTTQLLKKLKFFLDSHSLLLPIPEWLIKLCASLIFRRDIATRLCGSLQVDISETIHLLGWTPPQTVDEGLGITAKHFRSIKNKNK